MREIRVALETLAADPSLKADEDFGDRIRALDFLEFILDRLESLAENASEEARFLVRKARELRDQLEARNESWFQRTRDRLRAGTLAGAKLMEFLRENTESGAPERAGYDTLDVLLNGIFCSARIPSETKALEADMVFYQKTPGRVVLELVERANFTDGDVFYDLGSGLGQVPMLVNLLSRVVAKGVERETAYVRYSEQAAAGLGLGKVSFLEADVREAELSDGTAFFLYTPFTGKMLAEVLEKLGRLAARTSIRLFTYGPCTGEIFKARGWIWENPEPPEVFKLGAFTLR